jgi:nitrogen fixation protein FixH
MMQRLMFRKGMVEMVRSGREFTGRHMAVIMTGFFTIVVVANLTMAIFASRSWTGLVVKNSYVASQEFNEKTAKAEYMKSIGFNPGVRYSDGMLTVELGRNTVASNASVALKIGRPTSETADQSVSLSHRGFGKYTGEAVLGEGVWRSELTIQLPDGETWITETRFLVE